MLTVTALLDDASLGLELVAGNRAADREIEAAAVSELSIRVRGCRAGSCC